MSAPLYSTAKLATALKALWPRHWLADVAHALVESTTPWVKNAVIRYFLLQQRVDMREAVLENPYDYPSFNSFFSRALKAGARNICPAPDSLTSPVDGHISELGYLHDDRLLQAKGRDFSLEALLATAWPRNSQLRNGAFLTLYLAPGDYHRVHMPLRGRLLHSTYVPGSLFSLNSSSVKHVDNLYARNERLICEFDSMYGRFALVLVGAGFVSGIVTRWAGLIARKPREICCWDHQNDNLHFDKGEEVALFRMGSTVLVLLPNGCASWNAALTAGQSVRMGEPLAHMKEAALPTASRLSEQLR